MGTAKLGILVTTGDNSLWLGLDTVTEMKIALGALSGINQNTWVPEPESIERKGIDSSQSQKNFGPPGIPSGTQDVVKTQHIQAMMGKKELTDVRREQTGYGALSWGTPPVLKQADCIGTIPANLDYFLMDRRCFVLVDQTIFTLSMCFQGRTGITLFLTYEIYCSPFDV